MNAKHIIAGVGLIGYGALVGWAATSDYYERNLDDLDERVNLMLEKMHQSEEAHREAVEALDNWESIPVEASAIFKAKSESQRLMEKARLESMSISKEGMGELHLVEDVSEGEVTETEPENSPEGETVETDETTEANDTPDEPEEVTRSRLQSLIDTYTADPDTVEQFIDRAAIEEKPSNTPPYVIPREKFAWDEEEGDQYDKVTAIYYPHHRVAVDEEQEIIDDVANTLGWKNLARFGDDSGDQDVVFIRNRRLMTDFEVVREEEEDIPLHIKYGMSKTEYETNKAAGVIRFRPEDT